MNGFRGEGLACELPPVGGLGEAANNNPINSIRRSVAESSTLPHRKEAQERAEGETVSPKDCKGFWVMEMFPILTWVVVTCV